MHRIAEANC